MAYTFTFGEPGEPNLANSEGKLIVLRVTVTASGGDTFPNATPLRDQTSATLDKTKIRDIDCWRFNSNTQALVAPPGGGDAPAVGLERVVFYDPIRVSSTVLKFRAALELNATRRVAIRKASMTDPPSIRKIAANWITLKFANGTQIPDGSDHSVIPFDADAVGRLPSDAAFGLSTDAHAQWVWPTAGAKADLADWQDLHSVASPENLVGAGASKPDLDDPDETNRPGILFNGASTDASRFESDTSPPVLTTDATIAAVFIPDTDESDAFVVGRWTQANRSWALYFDGGTRDVVYRTRSGTTITPLTLETDPDDTAILVVLRRKPDTDPGGYRAWINGRTPGASGSVAASVETGGSLKVTVGARLSGTNWVDPYEGQINQVGLYTARLDDLKVSLLLHQMADRAGIALGTPVDPGLGQPYGPDTPEPRRRLDPRPIALISLYTGAYTPNIFGQQTDWRGASKDEIKAWLRKRIREALVGNRQQFEIMFNRPGGKYEEDIVPSFIWGQSPTSPPQDMVTQNQWDALTEVCAESEFNLSDINDATTGGRRVWFYTGGGLPLNDDGTLLTTGEMGQRVVAPATPSIYQSMILNEWLSVSTRFRCFFLDAGTTFYGKFVEMVHDDDLRTEFTLVSEAIATDPDARLAAPFFSVVSFGRGPWWIPDPVTQVPSIDLGYNRHWASSFGGTPIYFGVLGGKYATLVAGVPGGDGANNLGIEDIYRWSRKEALPLAWNAGYDKVGAAWDYATGRLLASRTSRTTRDQRGARV